MKHKFHYKLLFVLLPATFLFLALSAYIPKKMTANLPEIVVTTKSVTDITATSAVCNYSVMDPSHTPKTIGVCIGKGPNPTIAGTRFGPSKGNAGPVNFWSDMTGLRPATTLYVRAFCKMATGVIYGNEISFTTMKPN